jgi:hypothetical protein
VCAPELIRESQRLLNRARLISEQGAAAARIGGRTHPTSRPPSGAFTYRVSTLEAFGLRINYAIGQDSDSDLEAANRWAAGELDRLQHGPKVVAETRKEFWARVVRDYPGVTAPVVARAERCGVTEIRSARVAHGRTARFGHKPAKGET